MDHRHLVHPRGTPDRHVQMLLRRGAEGHRLPGNRLVGSLGVTPLTPLQAMWASVPTQFIMDGPDEVHKVTISRNVLKGYGPHVGDWRSRVLPEKQRAARRSSPFCSPRTRSSATNVSRLELHTFADIS